MSALSRAALSVLLLFTMLLAAPAAHANIVVHFYSSDWGRTYPHAFVVIEGKLAASGARLSANYGFTTVRVTPTILTEPAPGYVQRVKPDYIAKARRHFAVRVDDSGYARLMARIAAWQARKQPSYNLNRANCVHFVMDLAKAAGLIVNQDSNYFQNPRRFLDEVLALNPGLK